MNDNKQQKRKQRTKMLKILHATISPCDNERRIFNQALTASRHGNQVEILALKTPDLPGVHLLENVPIYRIAVRNWRGGPFKFLAFNWKLFWRLLKMPFDILHAHDLWVLPAAAPAAVLKRKKLVYDAHEFYRGLEIFHQKPWPGRIWKLTERLLIGRAAAVIAINSFHAGLFKQAYPGLPEPLVLRNVPRRRENSNSPEFSEREPAVIFQGILKPGRGLAALLTAMKKVDSGKLNLIGFGELEGRLRQQAEESGLTEKVRFLGKIPLQNVLRQTERARAGLVLFEATSENYKFALPNKFFEYVMSGTPVIASDIPTFRRLFREFEVGLLVDPASPEAISRAIEKMLQNREEWERFHRNCLKARERWNWESEENLLLELYRQLSGA